jgi:hypothetical protein
MLYAFHEPLTFKPEFWGFEVRTYYSAIERGSESVKGIRLSVKRTNYPMTASQKKERLGSTAPNRRDL